MIEADKRKAIFVLHREGKKIKEISLSLKVSRNAVREIIRQGGEAPDSIRKDKIVIDEQLLGRLHEECEGRIQRIHEKLLEEQSIKIGYSTLSRRIRELGLGQSKKTRCDRVPDEIGAEMQHDTTPYRLSIGGKSMRVIASLIYFRYSKMRYLKFYRSFDRFRMKCFSHRLTGLMTNWDRLLAMAQEKDFSHTRFLTYVIEEECRLKMENSRKRRLKRAQIPEELVMETFPFQSQPNLDKKKILSIYDSFDYMTKKQNVIWVGPTGTGKSGLATAFLIKAINCGYSGRFILFPELIDTLYKQTSR